jgi:hypothetical protein
MLRAHSALRALLKKCVVSSVLVAVPVLVAGNAWAADSRKKSRASRRGISARAPA